MSAQLSTWVAVHRGDIDVATDSLDRASADLCLARAMLHRRRAAMARIVTEFFEVVGDGFGPYLAGGIPDVPVEVAHEIDSANLAASQPMGRYAEAPPLLYERALLADLADHRDEALRHLEGLLESYPGFFRGAILEARLRLAAGEPERAIWRLAPVEFEIGHTREGTAVLADALRTIGRHADACRYDRATVSALGHHDSRGNDCAPVDVVEAPVADRRMPLPYSLQWVGNRLLANERGNYYLVSAELSSLHLADLMSGYRPPLPEIAGPGVEPSPTPRWVGLRGMATRFGRSTLGRLKRVRAPAAPHQPASAARPITVSAPVAEYEILGPAARARIGRERLEKGLGRIFGQGLAQGAGAVVGPFRHDEAGWSGRVTRRPKLWEGARYQLFRDGEHRGEAVLGSIDRVLLGEAERPLSDVRRFEAVVTPAETWRLEPPFKHVDGHCWMASFPQLAWISDRLSDNERSSVSVLEDTRPLPRAHALHDEIASRGEGRFSHWGSVLYFSTSDGSDPNVNGRTMTVLLTSRIDAVEYRLSKSTTIGRRAFRKVTPPLYRTPRGWVGFLPDPPILSNGASLYLMLDAELAGTVAVVGTGEVCVGMGDQSYESVLSRVMHVFAARERRLEAPFVHIRGLMWRAMLEDLEGTSDSLDEHNRSSLVVCEDGRPLPHAHALHDDIADQGSGRFSHWNAALYFSTADGSDPNENGRTYSILIGRPESEDVRPMTKAA